MSNLVRTLALVAVFGVMLPSLQAAVKCTHQEKPMEQQMEELRAELSTVRQELKTLQSDIRKVLSELRTIKTSVAAKPTTKPAPKKRQPDNTVYKINLGTSPIRGAKDAPVTIVEFADFQCPYCAREWPKLKQILQEYPDKVKLVVKHFPLSFHKKAKPAHAAVEFAARNGSPDAFWKMHDMIIADYRKLDVPVLRGYAEKLGLNLDEFDKLMADPAKINEILKPDMDESRNCKVRGTPTVLVNGKKMASRSLDAYKARVEEILKAQPAK